MNSKTRCCRAALSSFASTARALQSEASSCSSPPHHHALSAWVQLFHASLFPECCRFSELHGFEKPSDMHALNLMDEAAKVGAHAKSAPTADREVPGDLTISALAQQEVHREFPDIRISFGESDEFSFVFHRDTEIYGRLVPSADPLKAGMQCERSCVAEACPVTRPQLQGGPSLIQTVLIACYLCRAAQLKDRNLGNIMLHL